LVKKRKFKDEHLNEENGHIESGEEEEEENIGRISSIIVHK
jgi:hypothetical protein